MALIRKLRRDEAVCEGDFFSAGPSDNHPRILVPEDLVGRTFNFSPDSQGGLSIWREVPDKFHAKDPAGEGVLFSAQDLINGGNAPMVKALSQWTVDVIEALEQGGEL